MDISQKLFSGYQNLQNEGGYRPGTKALIWCLNVGGGLLSLYYLGGLNTLLIWCVLFLVLPGLPIRNAGETYPGADGDSDRV